MYGYGMSAGLCRLASGKPNGRATYDVLAEGRFSIKGVNENGIPFERIVKMQDGEIVDNLLKEGGKTIRHIVYGQFETQLTPKGREIVRFHKQGRGKHGKSKRWGELFGHDGVVHSWYKRGRLVRQRFIYDNKRVAYDWNGRSLECVVKDYAGEILYEIKGALDGTENCYLGSPSVFAKPMHGWFLGRVPFEVKQAGVVVYKGCYANRQRVGEWIENGEESFYEKGVAIPKKLYETPPEKLNPRKILRIKNAQVRMAMCAKMGTDRIAEAGTIIHKDKAMRLISVKGFDVSILRVQCPSTKAFYYLRVPKDAKECEQARQWTFGVGDGIPHPIKFAVET